MGSTSAASTVIDAVLPRLFVLPYIRGRGCPIFTELFIWVIPLPEVIKFLLSSLHLIGHPPSLIRIIAIQINYRYYGIFPYRYCNCAV